MRNHIRPRGVYIPPGRPRPHRQCDLLSHKTPRQIRIERNVRQKFRPSKEKPCRNVRNLRRPRFSTLVHSIRIDPNDVTFDRIGRKFAITQSMSFRPPLVFSKFLKPRRVRRQYRFRIRLGRLDLIDVKGIPVWCKFQMRVHLHKVRLPRPQFTRVISCHCRSQRVRFVLINDADLIVFAILLKFRIGAEFFDAIRIRRRVADLGLVVTLFVLPVHLHPRPALISVQAKTILDDDADVDPIGMFGLLKGTT
mmetsp:Transcript_79011/g.118814  ORF Transcript_79011/g.118814 Transcript_79011/m.118814 type:complete len:251 (-) Transcript_79011:786-1538(-)